MVLIELSAKNLTATIIAVRKLEEQEKAASKVDSSENIENETEENVDADKGEGSQIESRADTSKKPSMSRGESKQSHTSQVIQQTIITALVQLVISCSSEISLPKMTISFSPSLSGLVFFFCFFFAIKKYMY